MESITNLFASLLEQHGAVDIAHAEFRKLLADDPQLKEDYSEWCQAVGSSEKRGFLDFCDDYLNEQHSKYDSLSDYAD